MSPEGVGSTPPLHFGDFRLRTPMGFSRGGNDKAKGVADYNWCLPPLLLTTTSVAPSAPKNDRLEVLCHGRKVGARVDSSREEGGGDGGKVVVELETTLRGIG